MFSGTPLIVPDASRGATDNVGRMAPRIAMISKARRMARGIDRGLDFIPCERGRLFWRNFSPTIPGAIALALSVLFGMWILYLRPAVVPNVVEAPAVAPVVTFASNSNGTLFDPRSSSGSAPVSLAQRLPLKSTFESILPAPAAAIAEPGNVLPMPRRAVPQIAESAPLPIPRPAELGLPASHSPSPPGRRLAQQNRMTIFPTTPADNRTFFEKLFGVPQPSGPVLAYAAPEGGVLGNARSLTSSASARYDRWTAVYDVAAHTVYLPNGTRLEAHSGLGDRLDDPRHVNERMRGATPPLLGEQNAAGLGDGDRRRTKMLAEEAPKLPFTYTQTTSQSINTSLVQGAELNRIRSAKAFFNSSNNPVLRNTSLPSADAAAIAVAGSRPGRGRV
jgi:hypothetical protein